MVSSKELVLFGKNPPYAKADATTSRQAVVVACKIAAATAAKVASVKFPPNWETVMRPLDEAEERLSREFSLLMHMDAVKGSDDWHKAFAKSISVVEKTSMEIEQHRCLYARLNKLKQTSWQQLSPIRRRILEERLASSVNSGVALPASKRRKLAQLRLRQAALGAKFDRNMRQAINTGFVEITDKSSLVHLPPAQRDAHRHKDRWRFGLLEPSTMAIMCHCTDRAARKKMLQLRNAMASDLGTSKLDNTPIVVELIKLRSQEAKLLGYPNYASLQMQRRMAKKPTAVRELIGDFASPAIRKAKVEMANLQKFAKRHCGIDELAPWDISFASQRLGEKEFGMTESQQCSYFGIEKVLQGMFACFSELFAVQFKRAKAPVWHSDVMVLSLVDASGKNRGNLYMDLVARLGKRGGAWADDAVSAVKQNNKQQLPIALVNCNFAGGNKKARLTWGEIEVLYHEMGHAMHHLLSKQEDYAVSGMNLVEWDAVELPSQLFENFAWQPDIMRSMSSHETTGKRIPPKLIASLAKSRIFHSGLHITRQLGLLAYDLAIHSNAANCKDPIAVWRRNRNKYSVVPHLQNDRLPCKFAHIFAGGYSAGYYGYLWAEVMSADVYSMFCTPKANRSELGNRLWTEVLSRGGSRPAEENFRALRGRDPRIQPLLRQLAMR